MEKPFSAYRGDGPYAFVCYAHDDSAIVYPELQYLRGRGVNVWYDEGIPAGSNWRAHIGGVLDGATQVLFYVSQASVSSDHCNREINYALDEGKHIVPVLLDDTPLPADLKMGLSRVQMIHRRELSADAYQRALAQALTASTTSGIEAGSVQTTQTGAQAPAGRRKWMAIAVALIVVGAFAVYKLGQGPGRPEDQSTIKPAELTTTPADKSSIAVLPFVNMSSDPEQEYFSDGISEELLNLLAKNPELKVISRSSAFTFKGKDIDIPTVAERLGVAHVLEGAVRKSGNTVRITAQLIDAETDTHLWSETYDRQLTDIFAIQDEIAGEVVEALNLTLFGTPATKREPNLDAYALYLQGRHLKNTPTPENLEQAEAMLKQALNLDPNYADAWIELADVYGTMRNFGIMARDEARRLNHEALERARGIDPENADIYGQLAFEAIVEDRDLTSAVRQLQRGLALDPTNLNLIQAAAGLALNLGRLSDAASLAEYHTARDPLCAFCFALRGLIYMLQGRPDDAAAAYETYGLVGGDDPGGNAARALVLLLQGKHEASLAMWTRVTPGHLFRVYGETITYYSMGREAEFATRFRELKDQFGGDYPTMVARVYAWMGDVDTAFEWLDRYTPGQPQLGPVIVNHFEFLSVEFQPLHDDPRWHAHLQRLGVAPEQLAAIEFDISPPK